jgi:hypothetical protein
MVKKKVLASAEYRTAKNLDEQNKILKRETEKVLDYTYNGKISI